MSGDHFSDVHDNEINGYGSLGGGGASKHYSIDAKPTKEGYKITCDCDNCGVPNAYLIEWPEITYISQGALPDQQAWYIKEGRIVPNVACRSCKRDGCKIGITPDEAQRWVKAGMSAGFVPPQAVQQWAQAAAMQAQRR